MARFSFIKIARLSSWISLLLICSRLYSQGLPEGFSDQLAHIHPVAATGITFDDDGRLFVWEKQGRVRIYESGRRLPEPLIDLREEVGNWRDHGLLGFALHPNFSSNGYFYLLYAVDRYHLLHADSEGYQADSSQEFVGSIGRLTRYTADPASNFTQVVPGSRKVLIGDTPSTGIPLVHQSHGVGALVFGTDGSLLVSCGDGASYSEVDIGQGKDTSTYAAQALLDGILSPEEDIGAFRSQSLHSLNGKILRIDPLTGSGMPGNPFFDAQDPVSIPSRIWALGLRNPFRMVLQPETGAHDPDLGEPGTLWVGDVGWYSWEELNVIPKRGANLGWPLYEGIDPMWPYFSRRTPNFHAPISTGQGCGDTHVSFQDLLGQVRQDGLTTYSHPCDNPATVSNRLVRFTHLPPAIKWSNQWNESFGAYVPTFDPEGNIRSTILGSQDASVNGEPFTGGSSTAGVFYTASQFPESYRGLYFHGDFSQRWIKAFRFSESGELLAVEDFQPSSGEVVSMAVNPLDGCLYYLRFPRQIRKICFGGNQPPTAQIEADRLFGSGPLTVRFSGKNSIDPEGERLSYHWDFGDGYSSIDPTPIHTFVSQDNTPTSFPVTLLTRDLEGDTASSTIIISLNNTPPEVQISSIQDSSFYGMTASYFMPLVASVSDKEHGEEELGYRWETFLHHNTHYHPEPVDTLVQTSAFITPAGCEEEAYWYRFRLTVTDEAGLSGVDEVVLFPDCGPPTARIIELHSEQIGNRRILINWKSEYEHESHAFEVQRAVNGDDFRVIGELPALGKQDRPTSYTFSDLNPTVGILRYRIKAVNRFGSFVYSEVETRAFPTGKPWAWYPNPSAGTVTLQLLEASASPVELRVLTLEGRQVLKEEWIPHTMYQKIWDLSFLADGVYGMLISHNGEQEIVKLVLKKGRP